MTRQGDTGLPALLAALLLWCHWQGVAGCRVGRSLLDFISKNIYLLPREGTMGRMDLSGFDMPPGDPRERVSKAEMLPVLLPPVLQLDLALSPMPVPMSQVKQMIWGKTALCQCHDLAQPDHQICGPCAGLALLERPRNRLIPQRRDQCSNKTP